MASRDERARRAAARHESRQERVDEWLDGKMNKRGMRPRYAAYLVIVVWLVAVLVFGIVERIVAPHPFKTIWLAWWWAITTVTTVGYGDVVPGQPAGKAIGSILMLGGLSFLSVLTATITSAFVQRRQRQLQERGDDPVMKELQSISKRLELLEHELRDARGEPPADEAEGV